MNPSLPIRYVIHYSLRIRMRQEINLEFWRFMADNSFHIFSRQLVPISRFDTSYKRVMSKRATSLTQMNTSVRNGRSDACFFMQPRAIFFTRFNNWLFSRFAFKFTKKSYRCPKFDGDAKQTLEIRVERKRNLKLGDLGEVSFRMLKLGELGEL